MPAQYHAAPAAAMLPYSPNSMAFPMSRRRGLAGRWRAAPATAARARAGAAVHGVRSLVWRPGRLG